MERYCPRTFTKRLKMLMGVLKPPEVKHIREVQAAVEDWETRVRRLEEENQSYDVNVRLQNGVGRNGQFRITF